MNLIELDNMHKQYGEGHFYSSEKMFSCNLSYTYVSYGCRLAAEIFFSNISLQVLVPTAANVKENLKDAAAKYSHISV